MGYRASRQSSIKQSPYYMLYQKNMCLPIDNEILPLDETEDVEDSESAVKLMSSLLVSREKSFNIASDNIKKAQCKQKETYDKRHETSTLPIRSKVLLQNTAQKQRKGGKMDPLWLGPYIIHRYLGKGVYKLAKWNGKVIKQTANINRLKRYIQRSSIKPPPQSPKKRSLKREHCFPSLPDKPKKMKVKISIIIMHAFHFCYYACANKLLREEFPSLEGLQTSLLSQSSFSPVQIDSDSVRG